MSDDPSRGAVLAALEAFPARLAAAALEATTRPVATGEWGPDEVVRHLIACETDVHQSRLSNLATDAAPVWGWAEPVPWPGEPDLTVGQLLDRFAALRAATLGTVAALDETGWARTGTHEILGVFDVRVLLANAVSHDEDHLASLA